MHFINSSSLVPHASHWLANSRHPRILHVFDCACNLINERGEVLSVVTRQIGNGPFNLVVVQDICFFDYLSLESRISPCPAQITLGDLTVQIVDANPWSPRPDWESLHARKGEISHQLTQLRITNYATLGGFHMHLGKPFRPFNYQGLPTTQSLISNLFSSLAVADFPSSLIAVQQLAGLGIGLTPSGDDLIMGAIYATWIIHPPELARTLAEEIANTAAPLTTSLSAAWLRSAGRGEAGILWHEFFDALVSKDHIRIEESKKKILAVGETSGADALTGFIGLFVEWGQQGSNL